MAYTAELYDTTSVGDQTGSDFIAIQELDANDAYTGDPVLLPALSTSNIAIEVAETETELESGTTFTRDGATTRTFTATFAQSDVTARNLFNDYKDKNFTVVKEAKRTEDPTGGYQYLVIAKANISQNRTIDFKSDTFDVTFRVQNNTAEFTATMTTFDNTNFIADLSAATDVTIGADEAFALVTIP